jgi:hypothetical protein
VDIEGNDLLCLHALRGRELPPYVSVESGGVTALDLLMDIGYPRFKLIDQVTFCGLTDPPRLAWHVDRLTRALLMEGPLRKVRGSYRLARALVVRERLRRRYGQPFAMGSSGVWGDATDGPWLDYEQAARAYHHHRERHAKTGSDDFRYWCDWHAALA